MRIRLTPWSMMFAPNDTRKIVYATTASELGLLVPETFAALTESLIIDLH
jgi:hypothetical protein